MTAALQREIFILWLEIQNYVDLQDNIMFVRARFCKIILFDYMANSLPKLDYSQIYRLNRLAIQYCWQSCQQ